MPYSIKEIFYTLQGEGAHTGRPAIFCRFLGCNLWTGREEDRMKAICQFCDTDFIGTDGINGGKFHDAPSLAAYLSEFWPDNNRKFIVCTGGEPLLQLDQTLIDELHKNNFEIAVETNGTILPPEGIDWICVSPKAGSEFKLKKGNEIKIVYPQKNMNPKDFEHLDFSHFYIQPMDGPELQENIKSAIDFCKTNTIWKLSLQTHKLLNIP
jgi:7-carboxy-7-deazaguanine synthase (Cx14CxxC type)